MPFLDLLRQGERSDEAALLYDGARWSRDALARQATELAARLAREGMGPGTKVLVSLHNSPAFLIALLAVNQGGAVFMPVSPGLAPDERARIDAIGRPDAILADAGSVEVGPGIWLTHTRAEPYVDDEAAAGGLAAIIFTSGTTGTPKGVMLTEAAIVANARAVAGYVGLSARDRTLIFLPLHYAYTLSQVLSTLLAGGSLVLLRNLLYPVRAFAAIAEHGVTGFGGVPTSLDILAQQAPRLSRDHGALRYVLSAGGPLRPRLVEQIQQAFPGVRLFNNYGCTEIGPRATAIDYRAHPDKIGSIGRAISGVRVTLVRPDLSVADPNETAEIVLAGPSLMVGYYRDPQTTAARMSRHGFHTGDYASVDRDGFLHYQGRRDDLFKSAGEKISAQEVEAVVLEHEAVIEAAVTSEADPILGAVPAAYIVLRPGASCTARELQAFCARRLSRHKVPRAIHFVGELRKTASGKVQKYRLGDAHP